jgi:7-cyano-7-deazaguanine synthase
MKEAMKSVVLLSGGIDSTVALAHTKAELALFVDYGQTHCKELRAAAAIAKHYGIEHYKLDIADALYLPSALTGHGTIPDSHAEEPDATFVPGRNLLLIALATAWANAWGYGAVVIGANADDNAGYPDCRPNFIESLSEATQAGYGVSVWAPLVRMTKRQVIAYGRQLGIPFDLTWSCYRGGDEPCNQCGACESRNEAMA